MAFKLYKKRDKKSVREKKLQAKEETDKLLKKTKRRTRRHLGLGNTSAVGVFPGGCSQASKALLTILEGEGLFSNTITV